MIARPALAGDAAAAEALFNEAKALVKRGKVAEACPKFAESNRLDHGAGTLIHLADCYEKSKRSATAWATYAEAASAAQAQGRADWEKLARSRGAALEPKLAHLVVTVTAPAESIEVKRDDSRMSRASWGTPIPVDVGRHSVEATAAGRRPFRKTVEVTEDGAKIEVVIPALERVVSVESPRAGASAPAPAPAPVSDEGSSSRRTLGFVLGGFGLAAVATGAVTGLLAIKENNDSRAACPSDGACSDADAVRANDAARTFGTVSTIGFAAGGVALVVGTVLVLSARPTQARAGAAGQGHGHVGVAPVVSPRNAGIAIGGTF